MPPPPFPTWARPPRSGSPAAAEQDGMFQAGAALALVGIAVTAETAHRGVWLDRLALQAAAASLAANGRVEDAAAIRDAHHFTRPGDDPGPAGRSFAYWRNLPRRAPLTSPEAAAQAAALLGLPAADAVLQAAAAACALADGDSPPLAAAAEAAASCARLRPCPPAVAPWLADAVLARRLGWPVAVPLLALGLGRRKADPADPAWPTVCAAAYRRAAAIAYDLFTELEHRADILITVQGRLRAKGAPAVIAALLSSDALAPAQTPGGMTGRAGRRLFERLASLGAVRELTGRTAFRIFGL